MTMIRLSESEKDLLEGEESTADGERRNKSDRRTTLEATRFPVYTASGTWVRLDRRNTPERRVGSIDVGEDQLMEDEFMELFKDFS